jgi:hypothetical protein
MEDKSVKALREMARELGIAGYSKLRKGELISALKAAQKTTGAASKTKSGDGKVKQAVPAKSSKSIESAKPAEATKPAPAVASLHVQNEEQRIENAKYATGPVGATQQAHYPPDLGENIDNLPALSEPRLTLLMQKPGVLLASWYLPAGLSARQPGLRLRLGVLADKRFNVAQEVEVKQDRGNYYFHVDSSWPPYDINLQLGNYEASGRFAIAIHRGIVRLPRLLAMTALGVNWGLDEAEFEQVVSRSGPLSPVPYHPIKTAPSSPGWTISGGSGSGFGRRG